MEIKETYFTTQNLFLQYVPSLGRVSALVEKNLSSK
jgi:hypothetical protein